MLCEECGKNQATVAITVSAGGEVTTRRLCPECMKKMQFSLVSGDIQGFLSSVLSVLGSGQKVEEHTAVCSGCGLSYAEFGAHGPTWLRPVLPGLFRSVEAPFAADSWPCAACRTQAAAFRPSPEDERAARVSELRQKMDEAVASENFEDAAKYRDELRKLAEESGAAQP